MIETFLFGVLLYINSQEYVLTIESILKDKNFFMKHIQLIIIDCSLESIDREYLEKLKETYMGNIVYLRSRLESKEEAYNLGISYCLGKYIILVTNEIYYTPNIFQSAKNLIDISKANIIGIHIQYMEAVNQEKVDAIYKVNTAERIEQIISNLLCVNRYFIRQSMLRRDEQSYDESVMECILYYLSQEKELIFIEESIILIDAVKAHIADYQMKIRGLFHQNFKIKLYIKDEIYNLEIRIKKCKKWKKGKYFYVKGFNEFFTKSLIN